MLNKPATCPEIKEKVCDDGISALPTDLLVHILSIIPTKDAVATSVLSKPWRYIWTLIPKLFCKDTKHTNNGKSVWWFLEKLNSVQDGIYTCKTLKEFGSLKQDSHRACF